MKKISKPLIMIILIIIVTISAIVYGIATREDEGVCGSAEGVNCVNPDTVDSSNTGDLNKIETSKYSVIAPENVENESKSAETRGGIVLNYERPYGMIKFELFNSTLDYSTSIQRGEITETEVEVAGRKTVQAEIDYAEIIRGPSTKDLIRYAFKFDDIAMDDGSTTIMYINVLAKDNLSDSQINQFKQDAQDLIRSVQIKD